MIFIINFTRKISTIDEGNEVEMSSDNKYVDFKNIQKTPLSHAVAAEKRQHLKGICRCYY